LSTPILNFLKIKIFCFERSVFMSYPDPFDLRSDPQQELPVVRCGCCGGELYACDLLWRIAGEIVCEECFPDFALRYFAPCRRTGAELLLRMAAEELEREP
jgi:hypothetical protein